MDTHLDGQPGTFVRFSYLIATCASSGYGSSGHIATMAEAGYPDKEDVRLNMLLAPAGTPKEIVAKIHSDVAKAFAQPELVARFVERSIELVTSPSPEDFGQLIRSDVARLGKVAREAGIKAE